METKRLKQTQRVILRLFLLGSDERIKKLAPKLRPREIAEILAHLRRTDQIRFLVLLFDQRLAGATLRELPEELAKELIHELPDETVTQIIRRVPPDDAVDFLGYLPEERQEKVLGELDDKERWTLERLRLYDEDTAGGLMTTEYITLPHDLRAAEAVETLRSRFRKSDLLYLYVVDEHKRLTGTLPVRNLVFSDPDTPIREITVHDPVTVHPEAHQEEVAKVVSDFDLLAVPVVDGENRIMGVVTFDDVMDVIEEEATEDMYHLAGLDTAERVFTPVSRSVRLRSPWLFINLGTAMLAALTVSLFKDTISQFVALAVMMPIVANLGGNAGSQSLTVIVRGLALGELEFASRWKAILKEATVGLCTGSMNGVVMGAIAYAWYRSLWLSLILFVAMMANLVLAGLFGALIPLLLRGAGKDPALGSHIFVTTVTDVAGFFIFLGLATLVMGPMGLAP